jgi:hypothetical protein
VPNWNSLSKSLLRKQTYQLRYQESKQSVSQIGTNLTSNSAKCP